jgi:hypothetical protein
MGFTKPLWSQLLRYLHDVVRVYWHGKSWMAALRQPRRRYVADES